MRYAALYEIKQILLTRAWIHNTKVPTCDADAFRFAMFRECLTEEEAGNNVIVLNGMFNKNLRPPIRIV